MDLRIPFGILNGTNEVVEPQDAERGRACDCHCPGCDTPLLSRHPEKSDRRIHFAHDRRHPNASDEVIQHCPFNGPLTVALMAQHLAAEIVGDSIKTADLKETLQCNLCQSLYSKIITREGSITIDSAEASHAQSGAIFDLKINTGEASILIWLFYEDRPIPDIPFETLDKTGILRIDVNTFNTNIFNKGKRNFRESVKEFLLIDGAREWVYHPREKLDSKKHEDEHQCVKYACDKCYLTWWHNIDSIPSCPNKCGSNRFRKISN